MDCDDNEAYLSDASIAAAGGVAGVLASLELGADPVPAVVAGGLIPAGFIVANRLAGHALWRRRQRAGRALEIAAEVLDVGLGIIEERAVSHDERLELLARVLEAAARTPLEAKVRALGRLLADGLEEGAVVDEPLLLAAALADVEAAHIIVLQHFAMTPFPPDEVRRPNHAEPQGWEAVQLDHALPNVAALLDGLLAVLAGHGLIKDQGGVPYPGSIGPAVWAITELGRRCLFLLGDDVSEEARVNP